MKIDSVIEYIVDKCYIWNIEPNSIGLIVRLFHLVLIIGLILATMFCSKKVATYSILMIIFIIILYLSLNGCILTKIENKLCKDNYTLVDPILKIFSININKKNRYTITFCILVFILVNTIIYYYIRFY